MCSYAMSMLDIEVHNSGYVSQETKGRSHAAPTSSIKVPSHHAGLLVVGSCSYMEVSVL